MKTKQCFLILAAVILIHAPVLLSAAETLTLGKPDDLISDLSAHILGKAYQRIGIAVQFVELPAERSLIQADKGKTDGEVNRISGLEKSYPNLMMVPTPVNLNEAVVFSKQHDFEVSGWESLKPYTIAIRIGIKFVEKGTRGMKVFRFVTNEKVFSLVANGRYDLCISSRLTGQYEIQRLNLTGINVLEPPLTTFNLHHYLHIKHENLIPRINGVLEEMQRDGRMAVIRDQFISEKLHTESIADQSR